MEKASGELVSVIVPAFNAARTIEETLLSIRRQTHGNLDVIVVDDGSTDDTYRIAHKHSLLDERIRVIQQPNKGVAAARNRGIAEARGQLVATIDADDLWRPSKIARQVAVLSGLGSDVTLVYGWSAEIGEDGEVVSLSKGPSFTGDVLKILCYGNFVGNGSSALIRKSVLQDLGGYDSSLRDRDAQGCEDWSLFLRLAAKGHFAVVPDHLTGYRQAPDAMSRNIAQMLRSDALVRLEALLRHPEYEEQIRDGRLQYLNWFFQHEVQCCNWKACIKLFGMLLSKDDTRPRSSRSRYNCAVRMRESVAAAVFSKRTSPFQGRKFLELPDTTMV